MSTAGVGPYPYEEEPVPFDVDAVQALCDKALDGPWGYQRVDVPNFRNRKFELFADDEEGYLGDIVSWQENSVRFMAESRTLLPESLRIIRGLTEALISAGSEVSACRAEGWIPDKNGEVSKQVDRALSMVRCSSVIGTLEAS